MYRVPLFLFAISSLVGEETATKTSQEGEMAKISEAMGHLIGKNLQSLGLPLNIEAILRGISLAAEGQESPLSEEDCVQALAVLQEESMAKIGEKNLQEARSFLEKNQERKEISSLEEGKIQYEILKQGSGQAVQPYNSPLVRYKGHYLNGPPVPETEEILDLEETIAGFSKAIIGMKEGESRTLYIHPELGYGKQGNLHPNALLIFDVEVIKADASSEAHAASNREELPLRPRPTSDAPR